MEFLFLGGIGMQEILLIALVVLLFFGGKKIPELMKGYRQGRALVQGGDERRRAEGGTEGRQRVTEIAGHVFVAG